MKYRIIPIMKTFFTVCMLALIAGCGASESSNQGTGKITLKLDWGSATKATDKTVESAPAGVNTMRVIVSGSGITPAMQKDFTAAAGTGTIDAVPPGSGRTVTVQGLDASGTVTHQGTMANITVLAGQTTDAGTITMIENIKPVANAGTAQNVVIGTLVTLDGSGSSDANGDSLTYSWSLTSKPSGSSASLSNATVVKPTFTADVAGDYVLSLIVNDGKINSTAATVTITAVPPNSVPVANAGTNQNVRTGKLLTLDGSASSDANGDTLTYSWSFTSKPSGSNAVFSDSSAIKPTFTPDVDGSYVINLIVNDGKANSAPSVVTVKSVTDLSLLFSTGSSKSTVNINGYIQAGSQFSSTIRNVSNETFALTKYEFTNGGTVLSSTTSASLLNNNQLAAGQSVGIASTLATSKQDLGFVAKYYFTDTVTNTTFIVSVVF